MLPNKAKTLKKWEQTVILKTAVRTTVDFEPVVVITPTNIKAVVQVATAEQLKAFDIDWSLRYIWCHSSSDIDAGQYIEYKGINYKVISPSNWQDYGFSDVICEEVKGDIV